MELAKGRPVWPHHGPPIRPRLLRAISPARRQWAGGDFPEDSMRARPLLADFMGAEEALMGEAEVTGNR